MRVFMRQVIKKAVIRVLVTVKAVFHDGIFDNVVGMRLTGCLRKLTKDTGQTCLTCSSGAIVTSGGY